MDFFFTSFLAFNSFLEKKKMIFSLFVFPLLPLCFICIYTSGIFFFFWGGGGGGGLCKYVLKYENKQRVIINPRDLHGLWIR
ncbi:hypothetical protein Hdeb2414_s0009g00306001 [Helianthus debilis subsp. tardiflorus]